MLSLVFIFSALKAPTFVFNPGRFWVPRWWDRVVSSPPMLSLGRVPSVFLYISFRIRAQGIHWSPSIPLMPAPWPPCPPFLINFYFSIGCRWRVWVVLPLMLPSWRPPVILVSFRVGGGWWWIRCCRVVIPSFPFGFSRTSWRWRMAPVPDFVLGMLLVTFFSCWEVGEESRDITTTQKSCYTEKGHAEWLEPTPSFGCGARSIY